MIKAVMFDLDGVLLDAKEWHYHALNSALSSQDLPQISLNDHLTIFDGLPTKIKLRMLGVDSELASIVEKEKQFYTQQLIRTEYKQNLDTLNALKILKNEGYVLALCSNSVRSTVDLFLDVSDYGYYFDLSLSNNDVKKAKPSPEIYERGLFELDLNPKETLVLEDNDNGIRAVVDAGCNLLRVDGGVRQVTYRFIKDEIGRLNGRV